MAGTQKERVEEEEEEEARRLGERERESFFSGKKRGVLFKNLDF